jgi:hypothetical protein
MFVSNGACTWSPHIRTLALVTETSGAFSIPISKRVTDLAGPGVWSVIHMESKKSHLMLGVSPILHCCIFL